LSDALSVGIYKKGKRRRKRGGIRLHQHHFHGRRLLFICKKLDIIEGKEETIEEPLRRVAENWKKVKKKFSEDSISKMRMEGTRERNCAKKHRESWGRAKQASVAKVTCGAVPRLEPKTRGQPSKDSGGGETLVEG